jgi:replicative DNA helicase
LERLSTGSAAFDRILGGGMPVRSLSVIAGEPGAGKTLFALQVLFHLARQGKKRHATDVRRMNFTENGIEVGSPFKGLRGVLTGLPLPVETKET